MPPQKRITRQKEEASALKKYEELKAAKEDEIKDGKTMEEEKTQELATTDEKHAQSVEDLGIGPPGPVAFSGNNECVAFG